jgi:hypothetical protein
MYSIDFEILISDLLPWFLRTVTFKSWISSLLYPLQVLYADFLTFRTEQMFRVQLSGQVAHLEFALNYLYYGDGTLRRIIISDSYYVPSLTVYNATETEESIFVFNSSESEASLFLLNTAESIDETDFIVLVPEALLFDENKMRSTVNIFKLAGSRFLIQTYIA